MKNDTMKTDIISLVTNRLYKLADEADWVHLNINERKALYEQWTEDSEIGGSLRKIMEPNRVRVYIKDSILRSYTRNKRPSLNGLLKSMSIECGDITKEYIKPQAILCGSTDLYTLAVAKEWKMALMSAFEREAEIGNLKRNRVFFIEHTSRRFVDTSYRNLIEGAAKRLGIEVQWIT